MTSKLGSDDFICTIVYSLIHYYIVTQQLKLALSLIKKVDIYQ